MNRAASWLKAIVPPIAVFVLGTALAEIIIRTRGTPAYILPTPSKVFEAIVNRHQDLLASLWTTAAAALTGFALSIVVGITVAIALSTSKMIQRAFYPYTVFFQTVPVVAIAPLLVIWYGAGMKSVVICAFIVSVFPVIANTLAGLLSTDPALKDLFKLYGSNWVKTMWKLRLPSALPNIMTGLRIAAGLAVIGTVVGEFVAGLLGENPGLGILIIEEKKWGHTDMVFAAVLMSSLLGLAMFAAVNLAGYLTLRRWHASEKE